MAGYSKFTISKVLVDNAENAYNLNGKPGSYYAISANTLITASVSSNILTFTKGDGSTFNLTLPTGGSGSGGTTSGSFTGSFTGSLLGTASWAQYSLTASYFSGSISNAISASYAVTASYVLSASYAKTASYVLSSSYANIAGDAIKVDITQWSVSPTTTYPTFVADYGTAKILYLNNNFSYFPSTNILNTTASYALNAVSSSYSATASLAPNYVLNSATSSFVTNNQTSSFVLNSQTSSMTVLSSSYSATASLAPNYVLNSSTSSFVTNSQTSSFVQNSQTSSFVTNSQTGSFTTTSSFNAFTSSINGITESFLTTGSSGTSQTINGSLVINQNLTVLGSASITNISQSTLNIGTNLITVNTNTPSVRFGGLAVIDSGSSPQRSGSILFDSTNDQWIFVHQTSGITSSLFIMGPETYNNIGNETNLTNNKVPKSLNAEHIGDSNITDDGTTIQLGSNTQVTGSLNVSVGITGSLFGTSSWATNAITASYVVTAQTASYVLNAISSSYAATASLAPNYVLNSVTSSFVTNSQTSSFVQNSQTSSMTVLSSSYAATASYALNGGVTQIIAGTNISISPTSGTGSVTISSTGGVTKGFVIAMAAAF